MKRQRTGAQAGRSNNVVIQSSVRRPIDKQLKSVEHTVTTTQATTVLYTVSFPGTMVGLRWDVSTIGITANAARVWWAIVVVKDGLSPSSMATSDGSSFYQPEANVLTFGTSYVSASTIGASVAHEVGSTKAMRKLQNGDKLQFIVVSDILNGAGLNATCQFFIKS